MSNHVADVFLAGRLALTQKHVWTLYHMLLAHPT